MSYKGIKVVESGEIMFIGEYNHAVDAKKRLALPSKFRKELGKTVVVTRGLDQCLFVYPMNVWTSLAEKLGTMPIGEAATRSFVRLMLAGAIDVNLDAQGRALLPDYLKEYAGIDREVIVAGLFNRLEVWDREKWHNYKKRVEGSADQLAENLGKLGIY
jgi:MraZ protein